MRTPTVLVLGAGASKPYGLPIGSELVSQIAGKIASGLPTPGSRTEQMRNRPRQEMIRQQARALADRIRRSGAQTIDAFLETCNSDDRTPIIHAMIDILWRKEHEVVAGTSEFHGDWLRWLYHQRLMPEPDDFKNNQLIIISFNYDRLPHLRFATMMGNMYNSHFGQTLATVGSDVTATSNSYHRFQHIHGSIAIEPTENHASVVIEVGYDNHLLAQASENIQTMGATAEDVSNGRWKKSGGADYFENLWHWPERVLLLGVGYHNENMKKIGLHHDGIDKLLSRGCRVGGTAYGLDKYDRDQVIKLVGSKFILGSPKQDCLSFLREHLGPDT